ncbi:MAG: tetratricopeptide repeat protein [Alcanivoracaceae bacterium]|nr:tetratricopeptide repeat protein [Alcanivoracaceae bacterium]
MRKIARLLAGLAISCASAAASALPSGAEMQNSYSSALEEAWSHMDAGRHPQALGKVDDALEMAVGAKSIRLIAAAHQIKGIIYMDLGDIEKQLEHQREALLGYTLLRSDPDIAEMAVTIAFYEEKRDLSYAEKIYKIGLESAERAGKQDIVAISHYRLGRIAFKRGLYDLAIESYEKAIAEFPKGADPFDLADYHWSLGGALARTGREEEALEPLIKAREIFLGLGEVSLAADVEEMMALAQRAVELRESLNDP